MLAGMVTRWFGAGTLDLSDLEGRTTGGRPGALPRSCDLENWLIRLQFQNRKLRQAALIFSHHYASSRLMKTLRSAVVWFLGLAYSLPCIGSARGDEPIRFNRDIRPILSE